MQSKRSLLGAWMEVMRHRRSAMFNTGSKNTGKLWESSKVQEILESSGIPMTFVTSWKVLRILESSGKSWKYFYVWKHRKPDRCTLTVGMQLTKESTSTWGCVTTIHAYKSECFASMRVKPHMVTTKQWRCTLNFTTWFQFMVIRNGKFSYVHSRVCWKWMWLIPVNLHCDNEKTRTDPSSIHPKRHQSEGLWNFRD